MLFNNKVALDQGTETLQLTNPSMEVNLNAKPIPQGICLGCAKSAMPWMSI